MSKYIPRVRICSTLLLYTQLIFDRLSESSDVIEHRSVAVLRLKQSRALSVGQSIVQHSHVYSNVLMPDVHHSLSLSKLDCLLYRSRIDPKDRDCKVTAQISHVIDLRLLGSALLSGL